MYSTSSTGTVTGTRNESSCPFVTSRCRRNAVRDSPSWHFAAPLPPHLSPLRCSPFALDVDPRFLTLPVPPVHPPPAFHTSTPILGPSSQTTGPLHPLCP